jgi:hypothetical protein
MRTYARLQDETKGKLVAKMDQVLPPVAVSRLGERPW